MIVIISFIACLLVITAIGVWASVAQHHTTSEDYLIASREIPPWLAALSAVATNNSGFMFVALIALTFRFGVESCWMMVGWILGDLAAWYLVHPKLRSVSGQIHAHTIPGLIGTADFLKRGAILTKLGGAFTFFFLGIYAAGQLKAGSYALETLFGWDQSVGILLGTAIVVVYCFSGGIRASIWTDAAQSLVMIVSMLCLVVFAYLEIGGPAALLSNLEAQDPKLVNWMPAAATLGFLPFFLGMVSGGFGAIGQPHILVRFMAIDSVDHIRQARRVYFAWFVPFFFLAIAVGLYSRAILPDLTSMDFVADKTEAVAAEYAMPILADTLLPRVLVGLLLAGLFSATMSTADSQILVCSGSVTQDVFPRFKDSYLASKVATLIVAGLAMWIALAGNQAVFDLVLDAWALLACTLGPLVILRIYNIRYSTVQAILMMVTAVATLYVWDVFLQLDGAVYKLLPGLIMPFVIYLLTRRAVSGD